MPCHCPRICRSPALVAGGRSLLRAALSSAASLLNRKTGSGMVKWPLHTHFEVDRSIPIRIDVTRRAGGEAEERAASRHCLARCRFWEMVCFSFCGLASEDELLAHKREVAVANSRFMNAAPVDVIDRLKPVLLSGVQEPCRTGLSLSSWPSTVLGEVQVSHLSLAQRTLRKPRRPILSRVRCIVWFATAFKGRCGRPEAPRACRSSRDGS
jgi:hypothetical protein